MAPTDPGLSNSGGTSGGAGTSGGIGDPSIVVDPRIAPLQQTIADATAMIRDNNNSLMIDNEELAALKSQRDQLLTEIALLTPQRDGITVNSPDAEAYYKYLDDTIAADNTKLDDVGNQISPYDEDIAKLTKDNSDLQTIIDTSQQRIFDILYKGG